MARCYADFLMSRGGMVFFPRDAFSTDSVGVRTYEGRHKACGLSQRCSVVGTRDRCTVTTENKVSPLRRRGVGVAAFSLGLSPFSFADKGEITTREMVLCRDEPPI